MDATTTIPTSRLIDTRGLEDLYDALVEEGYRVIGPTVQDDAIVLRELSSAQELPFGWGVRLQPGGYRLRRRDDTAAFGHSAGPQSWKRFLHPPRERLWSATRTADGFELSGDRADDEPPRYAFLGVRPCDLRAIAIQDRVLAHPDSRYAARRAGVFIIAVNCTEPGETCFCASMGTGPGVRDPGHDLALTGWSTTAGTGSWSRSAHSRAWTSCGRYAASEPTTLPCSRRGRPWRRRRAGWAARCRPTACGA